MNEALALALCRRHMHIMATKFSESTAKKTTKSSSEVLGRSALTGRFVLAPATSKGATITMREANSAVKSVISKKK